MFWQTLSVTAVFAILFSDYAEYEKGSGRNARNFRDGGDGFFRKAQRTRTAVGGKGRNKTAFPNDVNVIDCYGNYYGSGIYDDVSAGRRKGRYNYEKCNKNYFLEEDAIGVVEIILILVILIALVLIFKTKITSVVTKAFTNFTRDTGKILA